MHCVCFFFFFFDALCTGVERQDRWRGKGVSGGRSCIHSCSTLSMGRSRYTRCLIVSPIQNSRKKYKHSLVLLRWCYVCLSEQRERVHSIGTGCVSWGAERKYVQRQRKAWNVLTWLACGMLSVGMRN